MEDVTPANHSTVPGGPGYFTRDRNTVVRQKKLTSFLCVLTFGILQCFLVLERSSKIVFHASRFSYPKIPKIPRYRHGCNAPDLPNLDLKTMATTEPTPKDSTITFTLRNPPYSYFHLRLRTLSSQHQQPALDEITVFSYLTDALKQYLGLTGTAIPIDILKVEGLSAWIRVPHDDELAVTAAITQWVSARGVSFQIEARGPWLGGVVTQGMANTRKLWSLEGEGE